MEIGMVRILVINDNASTLETYRAVLNESGHISTLAETAREGLEAARAGRYDLALVDLLLPDALDILDGLGRSTTVPVIVVTDNGSLDTAVEVMRRGAIDYAVKPLIGADLIAKVEWGLRYAASRSAPPLPPEAYAHAASRWAALVVAMMTAPLDIKTNRDWARLVGVSTTTLRDWCRVANTSAARSLALARLLRAVHLSRGQPWRPAQRLSSDPRTIKRLIARGGLPVDGNDVTTRDLLRSQSLVDDLDALLALRNALRHVDIESSS
jgi:DNA-binding response OmpR family regulator